MDGVSGNGDLVATMWAVVQEMRRDAGRWEEMLIAHQRMLADMEAWRRQTDEWRHETDEWRKESKDALREVAATLKLLQEGQTRHDAVLVKLDANQARHDAALDKHDVAIKEILDGTRGLAGMMQTLAVTMKGIEDRVHTLEGR